MLSTPPGSFCTRAAISAAIGPLVERAGALVRDGVERAGVGGILQDIARLDLGPVGLGEIGDDVGGVRLGEVGGDEAGEAGAHPEAVDGHAAGRVEQAPPGQLAVLAVGEGPAWRWRRAGRSSGR